MDLDRYALQILAELQRDARQTVQQLSAAVGLSPTPCWKRVKDLEAAGVIRGYTALVDRERVGLHLAVEQRRRTAIQVIKATAVARLTGFANPREVFEQRHPRSAHLDAVRHAEARDVA